mmetsp:Transcript_3618/g.11161  ORF Transcript_3618/g.11161 Transcript_3618/m.11161 type:complete len:118 (-) Transcript_3618:375-728(-)|eukprot:scaffold34763_cov36-Tisochrysis_lutea.AAC.1
MLCRERAAHNTPPKAQWLSAQGREGICGACGSLLEFTNCVGSASRSAHLNCVPQFGVDVITMPTYAVGWYAAMSDEVSWAGRALCDSLLLHRPPPHTQPPNLRGQFSGRDHTLYLQR